MGEPRRIVRLGSGVQDAVEQIGSNGTIGERRNRFARLGQIGISLRVKQRPSAASCSHPLRKVFGWHRINGKAHIGKTAATVLGRQPPVRSRMIGLEVKARHHSGHGVDLAAQLRHEEAVHHARGGQLEADRRADGDSQLIDARDALVGINEQPFPIERDDLNGERLDWKWLFIYPNQGIASVARIVGITIASMMPSELNSISRSAEAMGPFGSRTPSVQPPSVAALSRTTASKMYRMLDLACPHAGRTAPEPEWPC